MFGSTADSTSTRAWDAIRTDPGAVLLLMSASDGARNVINTVEPARSDEIPVPSSATSQGINRG